MGSRHFWIDSTDAYVAACDAAQAEQELLEQRASMADTHRVDFSDFEALNDGRFSCFTKTLSDGRYVVITDTGGMGYPESDDFMVCVYTNKDAFGDDPSTSLLSCYGSENFADIASAVREVTA